MARKREPPVALLSVKHEFVASLDNVIHEAMMMLNALEAVLKHDSGMKDAVKSLLKERCAALRGAMFTGEDQ